jgi:drug/metabolite transporter (DMT)-like permease
MTVWFAFALAAPVFWAVSNLLDARLLNRHKLSPLALMVVTGLFNGIPLAVIAATSGLEWPGSSTALLAGAAGALGLFVYLPYFHALELAPPSDVLMFWNLAPVFVALSSWLILGEVLGLREYLGIGLLLGSALMLEAPVARKHWQAAQRWMLLASLLLAMAAVLEKDTFLHSTMTVGIEWISISSFATACLTGLVLFSRKPAGWILPRQVQETGTMVMLVLNQLLDVGAVLCVEVATSLGSVSLVHAIGGLQPVFALVFGSIPVLAAAGPKRKWTRRQAYRAMIVIASSIAGLALVRL